jgi:integrase
MGTIYKRGKVWWIKYSRHGQPYFESSKSTKQAEARKLLKKREGEIADGKLPGLYFDRVRFEELAADYLTDLRMNGRKTIDKAERQIRLHLKPFFGGLRVTQITTAKIKAYIAKRLDAGPTNATVNRELAALRRMLKLGARCTPPKVDRVPHIPDLAENNVRKGFFEHEEYLRLHKELPSYLKPVLTFGYMVGWRKSEVLGLTWSQVDIKEGTVRLEPGDTKNKEARTVYMDEDMRALFSVQWSERRLGCSYVFHRNGEPIRNFYEAWRRACRRAGLQGKLYHDLRRTAVRNMVRAGIPERVAMMISGHKTRSVFDRYNIVSPQDLKEAASRLGGYLKTQRVTKTVTVR